MTDPSTATLEADLRRAGLVDLRPEEIGEFAAMAERVRVQAGSVTRMPHKTDEPAHVFRVALDRAAP